MNVNVVLITNMYDYTWQNNFKKYLDYKCKNNFYKPLFFEFTSTITYSIMFLDSIPSDCASRVGIIQARKQFLSALKYSVEELQTKIILLAASTKRLFGKNAEERVNWDGKLDSSGFTLSELYPDVLFTNGDNGTSVILNMEVESMLEKAGISAPTDDCYTENSDDISSNGAVIINGLGLLGLDSLEYLLERNLSDNQIIVISNHTKDLKSLIGDRDIQVLPHIREIKKNGRIECLNQIKGIVNCTHNPNNLIDYDSIKHLQEGQEIHVIDVAVPYGFPEEEYQKCEKVIRQDGGNAFIPEGLEFYFNPEICGLTENVLYGCFAEAMCLGAYLKENPDKKDFLREYDYFNVNANTKEFVKGLFAQYGVSIAPVPYNYMKRNET